MTSALAALLLLAAPALHLGQTKTADRGLPCPAHAAVEVALRELLPGLRVEGSGDLAEGDLEVRLAREEGRWLLSLRHPGGKVALERALVLPARDCALLGRTAALVIDRYLEEVRWSGRPPRLLPLPQPEPEGLPLPPLPVPEVPPPAPERPRPLTQDAPKPAPDKAAAAQSAAGSDRATPKPALATDEAARRAAAEKAAAEKAAAQKAAAEQAAADKAQARQADLVALAKDLAQPAGEVSDPLPPERFHLALLAGPGLYWGLPSDARFALSAGALLRRGRLQFGLSLSGTGGAGQTVGAQRGQTVVRTGLFALSAGLCADAAMLRLCGGPAAGGRLSLGSLSGVQILQPGSAALTQFALGGHGTAGLRLTDRLELSLDLLALWTPGSARFDVAGAPSRTLSALDLTWALRLGWLAF